jgi:hypothetical protein
MALQDTEQPELADQWSDRVDGILGGDLVVVLGYVTPRGGVVPIPVTMLGMRDRQQSTVTGSTSLGFWRKLTRIEQNPRVAVLYYIRRHGYSDEPGQILVQGDVSFPDEADQAFLEAVEADGPPFTGPLKTGRFWDRLTHEYYDLRVPLTVAVTRLRDLTAETGPLAEPWGDEPPPREEPAGGVAPRTRLNAAARQAIRLGNTVLGFLGEDGYPVIIPVSVEGVGESGLTLTAAMDLPQGGRRAGLLSHTFEPLLVRQAQRLHTGWLSVNGDDISYAPHTTSGYSVPGGLRTMTFIAALVAKRGVRSGRRLGVIDDERWVGSGRSEAGSLESV